MTRCLSKRAGNLVPLLTGGVKGIVGVCVQQKQISLRDNDDTGKSCISYDTGQDWSNGQICPFPKKTAS